MLRNFTSGDETLLCLSGQSCATVLYSTVVALVDRSVTFYAVGPVIHKYLGLVTTF